jgi:hypothetical protein
MTDRSELRARLVNEGYSDEQIEEILDNYDRSQDPRTSQQVRKQLTEALELIIMK